MKVLIQYKDDKGIILQANNVEKEMNNEEILVFQNCKVIDFPVNLGILYTVKHCEIENSVYDMFSEPCKIIITLKEI
jgi:hypothetical protein